MPVCEIREIYYLYTVTFIALYQHTFAGMVLHIITMITVNSE